MNINFLKAMLLLYKSSNLKLWMFQWSPTCLDLTRHHHSRPATKHSLYLLQLKLIPLFLHTTLPFKKASLQILRISLPINNPKTSYFKH